MKIYELLDDIQEGVHAYLESHEDTEPFRLYVKIVATEDEVTVNVEQFEQLKERQ